MTKSASYTHVNFGRSRRTAVIVVAVYLGLIAAIVVLDAALWLAAILALFTLPALWDLYSDRTAGVELSDTELRWFSGKRHAAIPLEEIAFVRFDTRMDLSVRVSVVLPDKKKVRLPYEALPYHQDFESALGEKGVKTERHHFSLL